MPITLNGTSRVKGSNEIVRLVGDRLNLVPRLRVYDTDAMKYRVPYPKTKASLPTGKSEESFATPISNGNDLSISSKELTLSEHAVGIEQTDYFNILSCADEKEVDDILEYRFYEKIEKDIIDALIDAESYEETVQASGEYLTFSDLRPYLLAVKKNGYENYVFYATRGQIEALEQENNVEAEVFFETGRINMVPVYELPVDSEIIFLIVNINNIPLVTNGKPSIEKVPTMKAGTQKKATWFYSWDIIDSVYNTAFIPKAELIIEDGTDVDDTMFEAYQGFAGIVDWVKNNTTLDESETYGYPICYLTDHLFNQEIEEALRNSEMEWPYGNWMYLNSLMEPPVGELDVDYIKDDDVFVFYVSSPDGDYGDSYIETLPPKEFEFMAYYSEGMDVPCYWNDETGTIGEPIPLE